MTEMEKTPILTMGSKVTNFWREILCTKQRYHTRLKVDLRQELRRMGRKRSPEAAIDAIIRSLARRAGKQDALKRSVLLLGPCRIGKTTIAKSVSSEGYHVHVPLDSLQIVCRKCPEIAQGYGDLTSIVEVILQKMPQGLIMEGVLDCEAAEIAKISDHAQIVFVGDTGPYRERAEAIMAYRNRRWCWTNRDLPEDEDILALARRISDRSHDLQTASHEANACFISLRASHADEDIHRAGRIISSLTS